MDPLITGALISGGSRLIGGIADNLFGGGNNHAGRDARQAVRFANRSAILDRVAAAKEAGISPLYALGAPTGAFATWAGGGSQSGLGATLSDMGADVGRAVAAGQTDVEREVQRLTLEKAGLENEFLRSQIASINGRMAREVGPPMPDDDPVFKVVPPQRTARMGSNWENNPSLPDAQSVEDRYGDSELLSTGTAIVNGVGDLLWNIRRGLVTSNPQERSAARIIWDKLFGK